MPDRGSLLWSAFDRLSLGPADFVISNPPYLVRGADEAEEEVARHEPAEALYAPEFNPLWFYERIAEGARERVRPGGRVYVELAAERAETIRALFEKSGWRATIIEDLNGRPRVLKGSSTWTR
jgi:release factor glutamine methyltransferase